MGQAARVRDGRSTTRRRDGPRRCKGIIDCKACQQHSTREMKLIEPQGAIGIEGTFGKRIVLVFLRFGQMEVISYAFLLNCRPGPACS